MRKWFRNVEDPKVNEQIDKLLIKKLIEQKGLPRGEFIKRVLEHESEKSQKYRMELEDQNEDNILKPNLPPQFRNDEYDDMLTWPDVERVASNPYEALLKKMKG